MSAGYDDTVLGFPAFPRGGRVQRRTRSWLGNAWLAAVEDTALSPESLAQGRAYSYAGQVGSLTVSPGQVAAPVSEPDGSSYPTTVYVDQLTDVQWDRLLAEVGAKSGYIAALMDADMPPELVDSAADAGIPLLPGPGDLESRCPCDEVAPPCRHAVAIYYQVARLLDTDPFVLLLRGRSRQQVLDLLRALPNPPDGPAGAATVPEVTPAAVALARDVFESRPAPLPPDPPVPADPPPPALDVPSALGVDRRAVGWLVSDAAARARAWLATEEPPRHLNAWQDSVRLAATIQDARAFARLRDASGRADELPRAATAWQFGGLTGLDALENPRTLTKPELLAATASIAAAWDDVDAPALAASGNRWTLVGRGRQLRYGRDRLWYPYRDEGGQWWPAGHPQSDPAVALAY